MSMYPRTFIEGDSGRWGVILRGHCVPLHIVAEAVEQELGRREASGGLDITEHSFMFVPRVKNCGDHRLGTGWACDDAGEWHSHWFPCRPSDDAATKFTVAFPTKAAT